MYQRILIPLDGSEEAEIAVDEVVHLSPNPQVVHLQLVENGVTQSRRLEGYAMYADQISDARRRSGEAYLAPLRERLEARGTRVEVSVESGTPLHQVAEKAEAWRPDLILFGGAGGGWLRRLLGLARIAPRLSRRVDARVLVIQEPLKSPEVLQTAA